MPTIALIDGMRLMMYVNDHPPPHFHVLLAEYRAVIEIEPARMVAGWLPRPKLRSIIGWARTRRADLLEAWNLTQAGLPAGRIE